jgi:putative restriction endonuclease
MTTYERAIQIYQVLTACAHSRQILTYELLGKRIGMPARGLAPHLAHLMKYCKKKELPPITVLVVQTESGKPGEGFTTFDDLHRDRERVFNHDWYKRKPLTLDDLKNL